ncbi:protein eyes shut homolog [Macaca fascicularis]|uniref:protein eyes shut homolog n=1 Tax=Macaca fascicularis TaxID=9541 RepID=UPI0032B03BDD
MYTSSGGGKVGSFSCSQNVCMDVFSGDDFSCVCYYGDSYLEFQNVVLNPQNNISLEFQTFSSYGLLLYVKQDSNLVDGFFIQLFIENGTLKYHFYCPGEAKFKSINTAIRVDDGQKYTLLIRQELDPCKAELTILGRNTQTCESINHVLGKPLPKSGSVFIGGFPDLRGKIQMPVPVNNFTGCIEVIEINNWRSFIPSKAVRNYHINNCRFNHNTWLIRCNSRRIASSTLHRWELESLPAGFVEVGLS